MKSVLFTIDSQSKSMGWFLYDNGLRHERVKKERDSVDGAGSIVQGVSLKRKVASAQRKLAAK